MMKKNLKKMRTACRNLILVSTLLFFALLKTGAESNTPEALVHFAKGNEFFQNGAYEKAIESYLRVDSMGFESPALYYNLGNSFFRSNKLGKARLYFEKALLMDPSDEDITKNLEFLESYLPDRFEKVPVLFHIRWIRWLIGVFSSDQWFRLSVFLFILFSAGLITFRTARTIAMKKAGFFSAIVFLVLSLSFYIFSGNRFRTVHNPGTAIIMVTSESVKSSPSTSGKELFILHEGTKVLTREKLDTWVEIVISDGRKGWIPAGSIEPV
jgi:tetratricopeptide (TPR) repeat protein